LPLSPHKAPHSPAILPAGILSYRLLVVHIKHGHFAMAQQGKVVCQQHGKGAFTRTTFLVSDNNDDIKNIKSFA
jgi:hypothetical protein